MVYRNLFLSFLVSIFCSIPLGTNAGMMMPNMNMEDFERELAEANRAIEEYVASLSPEEQAAFNQSVADMTQMFESMSEDDFEKFLGEMFADEPMMMEPNPFDIEPTTQQEEVAPEVVLSTEDRKKVETAIAILDDIIKQSNLFLVMVNSSSDLPSSINQWSEKGSIANWQSGTTWVKFKTEIENFIQKLYKAEEQDLTTKKYKYLFELIADEALYNNLIQLRTELNATVPGIEIPEFGVQKLTSEVKTAIKNILGKYAESFSLLGIPKALDDLFAKYAPEEEKIKAAEEAATKRAQETARMTRNPAAHTQAGTEEMDYGYGDYYGGGYDNYPYGGDYGYGGYGSPYDYGYSPDYGSYGGGDYGSGGGRSGGSGDSGQDNVGRAGTSEKENKEEKEKKEKEKKEKVTPDYELDTAVRDIKKDLEDIKDAFADIETETETGTEKRPSKLTNLVEHIQKDEKIDEGLAGITLPRIINKKLGNIDKSLTKINDKAGKLDADALAYYKKQVTKLFSDYEKELDSLTDIANAFTTPKDIEKEEEQPHLHAKKDKKEEKKNIIELPKLTQWAYFGGSADDLSEEEAKLKETISPVSLFNIRDKVTEIRDKAKTFKAKTAKAPKKAKSEASADILEMPAPPAF